MSRPRIVLGPSVDLSTPGLLGYLARAVELLAAELRRDGISLPDDDASETLRWLVAYGRAQRTARDEPRIACPPAASGAEDVGVSEVAELLGLSQGRVRQLASSGALPSTKDDSGRHRFERGDVDQVVASRERKPHT